MSLLIPSSSKSEEYRSRAPEFYGFVAWSSIYLFFVLSILWSFLPDEWIVRRGVGWYPNRYFLWTLLPVFHLRSVRRMGVAVSSGVVDGPRAPHDSLRLRLRSPPSRTPRRFLPFVQPSDKTPRSVSSAQPYLILQTEA